MSNLCSWRYMSLNRAWVFLPQSVRVHESAYSVHTSHDNLLLGTSLLKVWGFSIVARHFEACRPRICCSQEVRVGMMAYSTEDVPGAECQEFLQARSSAPGRDRAILTLFTAVCSANYAESSLAVACQCGIEKIRLWVFWQNKRYYFSGVIDSTANTTQWATMFFSECMIHVNHLYIRKSYVLEEQRIRDGDVSNTTSSLERVIEIQ